MQTLVVTEEPEELQTLADDGADYDASSVNDGNFSAVGSAQRFPGR